MGSGFPADTPCELSELSPRGSFSLASDLKPALLLLEGLRQFLPRSDTISAIFREVSVLANAQNLRPEIGKANRPEVLSSYELTDVLYKLLICKASTIQAASRHRHI